MKEKKETTNNNNKKEEFVKICPKCGSTDLNFDSLSLGEFDIRNGSFDEYCLDCKYGEEKYSTMFPEIEKNKIKEFKKNLKTQKIN